MILIRAPGWGRGGEGVNGYELVRVTKIDRDFMEKLPVAVSQLAEPLREKKSLRIVIDYDPQESKMEFRYYRKAEDEG